MGMKRTTPAPKVPKIDLAAAAKVIKGYVPGAVLERVAAGLDTSNRPFDPYSPAYRETLAKGGEDTRVDLRVTGGLINSVKHRGTVMASDSVTVTIAPDTGSSPQVAPAHGKRATAARSSRALRAHERRVAKGGDVNESLAKLDRSGLGRMKRTGKAGPPHNVVGAWIHDGIDGRMPPRPWLGLAPDQEKELREIIAAVVIKP